MATELEFLCIDFDVKEALDEVPRLSIKIKITNNGDYSLYIPPLNFDVNLLSIPPRGFASSYTPVGWLDALTSEPLFIGKVSKIIELYLPINSQRLERMLDIRQADCLVGFEMFAKGLCFQCKPVEDVGNRFFFEGPQIIDVKVRYTLPKEQIDRIIVMSEQFINIIEKLKHYELLRFEIPIKESKSSAQKDLNKALQLLHSAKDNLIHGEYESAMLNTRNALFNHLLQNKPNSMQQPPEKALKEEIKDFIISNVPTDTQETYSEIIEHLDVILRRVRHILSKFIHEGSAKLKQTPLRQDVELSYFLTLFVVRRLNYQISAG